MRKNATFNISIKLMNIHLAKPTACTAKHNNNVIFICLSFWEKKKNKYNEQKWESNVNKCSDQRHIELYVWQHWMPKSINADYHNGVDEKCKIRDPKRALNQHHAIFFLSSLECVCVQCALLCWFLMFFVSFFFSPHILNHLVSPTQFYQWMQ